MTDGPHRSQSMRPQWQKVAEDLDSDNPTVSIEDMCNHITEALKQDWHQEIPPSLVAFIRNVLEEMAQSGRDETIERLKNRRRSISGNTMGQSLLDYLIFAINKEKSKEVTIQEAVIKTLVDQGNRGARQVEEYHLLKASHRNRQHVRDDLEEAVKLIDFDALARQLLSSRS